MNSRPSDLEELQNRLITLELQYRRVKKLGISAFILPTLLLIMGQAPSKKTIEANEFALRDSDGNIRARLEMYRDPTASSSYPLVPRLVLVDGSGKEKVALLGDDFVPGLNINDKQGRARVNVATVPSGGILSMTDEHGILKMRLQEGEVLADEIDAGHVQTLDAEGFEAVLGTSDLVTPRTGEKHKTSAASLILFDKNKNVIWKAP